MTTSVVLDGIAKSYGSNHVLPGLDLTIGTGLTGLLGPNGAGKTTLLRIVATAMAPDRGRVRVLGGDPNVAEERREIRRHLGYLPQEPGFYPSFTAFEFVDYIAILKEMTERRLRHDEVRRVLGAVRLTDVMHTRIRKLSGGMRRRVGLAQALLGRPSLLVLDEPTAGLDPEQRLRFRELVSEVAERHTVLLSTHQTEDVSALCDRVVVMTGGRVRFDGRPAALVDTARGSVWGSETRDARARASWRTSEGRYRNVGAGAPEGAEMVEPTIEDAYLMLAGHEAMGEAVPA